MQTEKKNKKQIDPLEESIPTFTPGYALKSMGSGIRSCASRIVACEKLWRFWSTRYNFSVTYMIEEVVFLFQALVTGTLNWNFRSNKNWACEVFGSAIFTAFSVY